MTLETCKRLLKHYEDILSGETPAPMGHKNWNLVVAMAKTQAAEYKKKIARKERLPKYANLSSGEKKEVKVEKKKENKSEVKK